MLKKMKKIFLKTKENILMFVNVKKKWVVNIFITYMLALFNTVCVHAEGISDNLSTASSSAQQEVLGWVEALGVLGIIAGAVVWALGNAKAAKSILMCTIVGYILVKFAPDLWTWFVGIF